jgi:photosystem II stability/assembly factor-like uncharacterized protein
MQAKPAIRLVVAALLGAGLPAAEAVDFDSNTFGALRARSIGPAVMSGRIAAIDATAGDPLVIYAGAASGGVWKSRDAGLTWKPVFDEHSQSIGAIRIDRQDPETVWVGTGESWTRNSTSVGTGLYKTTDGGDSWELMGLADSERIARIQVHPEDGDTVWVCATGHLWDANEERGVYKTIDGGATWKRVLWVDADTGCSDLSLDPQDPGVLYAGMWQFRRYPDFFDSGGPGSGLYKSTDGGDSWRELTEGLPAGDKGRIAVAVAPSRPSRVYAVVEAEATALYRSDDLGERWTEMNDSLNVTMRPFYFAHLVVDPVDFDRVYKPGFVLTVSDDGGRSFTSPFTGDFGFGGVHPDHHALWINPANPQELVLGTDGGVYISYDRGNAFRLVRALPVSQFYEVSHDMEWPYNVYGGLQDNGTWMGPSRSPGGIRNSDWKTIGFGDGFHAYRDPSEPNLVYVEYQGGQLMRHHLATGEIKRIQPLPEEGEEDYRCNWNSPIHLSGAHPGTVYFGCQFLFRSRDRGESWEKISPDLTTDDPERQRQLESGGLSIDNSTAENNTTIYTISESPRNGDVVWVGTDDGLVQVTTDGGGGWTDVTANIPDLPPGLWVSHVEASPHDEAAALLTVDGHRSGDMSAYVYRTGDFGETWTSLATDDIEGFARVAILDPVNPDLIFLGTELGLYVSVDGGAGWARFTGDLPKVPVHDLDIHPREHDLIIGTHGRGVYILDDLTPLRALTQEVVDSKFALLPSRDAVMVLNSPTFGFPGDDEFVGRNPPAAASIFYYQSRRHIFGDLKVEVYDADGELITTLTGGKRKGMNRVDWPMRLKAPKLPPAASLAPAFTGPRVPEGTYTYKVKKGKETYEGTVSLVKDPRSTHSDEDRALQQELALGLYALLERLTYTVDAAVDLRDQARARAEGLAEGNRIGRRLEELADSLEEFRSALVSTSKAGPLSGDQKLREKLADVYGAVTGYDGRPTRSQIDRTSVLKGQLEKAESDFAAMSSGRDFDILNTQLGGRGLDELVVMTREEWETSRDSSGATSTTVPVKQLRRQLAAGVTPLVLGF